MREINREINKAEVTTHKAGVAVIEIKKEIKKIQKRLIQNM